MTDQPITRAQLNALERAADKVFGNLGLDIEFTHHFLDRVNDERNRNQITIRELGMIFVKEYKKWGRSISNMPANAQAVMKDLSTELNIPFVLNPDPNNGDTDLVAKTVMRKKNFHTPDKELPVESAGGINEGVQTPEQLIKQAQEYLAANATDDFDAIALMKKGDNYDSIHTQAPGFHQKISNGWAVVAYVEYRGQKIRTDTPHKYLKKLLKKDNLGTPDNIGEDETIREDGEQYIVKAKSPFWKTVHYPNLDDPRAVVMKKHIKYATPMSQERAEALAADIEGGANKWKTKVVPHGLQEDMHGAKKGSQVKGKEKTPSKSKPTTGGETSHPMRGRLVGEGYGGYWHPNQKFNQNLPAPKRGQVPPHNKVWQVGDHVIVHSGPLAGKEHTVVSTRKTSVNLVPTKGSYPDPYGMTVRAKHNWLTPLESQVTEDYQFMLQKGAWEVEQLRTKLTEEMTTPTDAILMKALEYLDKMVESHGNEQAIGGYAFDIVRSFNLEGIATGKELAKMYIDWKL